MGKIFWGSKENFFIVPESWQFINPLKLMAFRIKIWNLWTPTHFTVGDYIYDCNPNIWCVQNVFKVNAKVFIIIYIIYSHVGSDQHMSIVVNYPESVSPADIINQEEQPKCKFCKYLHIITRAVRPIIIFYSNIDGW